MAITHFKNECQIKILCDSCYKNITQQTRIQCSECNSDICVSCFYTAEPIKNHSPSHSYRAIEPLSFYVNSEKWSAFEEILLFEGIFMFGIGNWKEISNFIGTKSEFEVEELFSKICKINLNNDLEIKKTDYNYLSKDLEGDNTEKNKSIQTRAEEILKNDLPVFSNPNFHEISSFMPFRKDFDTEFENEYENIFKDINNDTLFQNGNMSELKNVIFDSYQNVLKLRAFKKNFIIEKNLLDLQNLKNQESAMEDFEIEILNSIKEIAPYISKNDFNVFFKGLCIEKYLQNNCLKKDEMKDEFFEFEKKRYFMLSDQEKKICGAAKITYKDYLKIKKIIIEEKLRAGFINFKKVKSLLGCKDSRLESIYKFFRKNKWI